MKKQLLLKTLLVAVCLLVGGASSAWGDPIETVGTNDNTTNWWGALSSNYTLKGNGTYEFNFTTTNQTGGVSYNTWTMGLRKASDTWKEYFRFRGDNYAYTAADFVCGAEYNSNVNTDKIKMTSTYSGSNLNTAMNGASVNMKVTRNSNGTFKAVASVIPTNGDDPFTMTCDYLLTDGGNEDIYIFFTVEKAYISLESAKLWNTVTFDFKSLTNQALPVSSDLAVNANSINYMRPTVLNEELGYRYGFRYNSGDWSITNDGAKWNSSGKKDDDFAILNVKAGDLITFNIASGTVFVRTANQINGTYYPGSTEIISGTTSTGDLTAYAALISGNTYTVKSNGNLYFQAKRNGWNKDVPELAKDYCVISSVTIQTTSTETVTSPTISVAAKDTKRTITLTSGTSSISSSVKTYYTLDGTTPTASSTKYTGSFDIDATKTIKAITISNSSIGTASAILEQEVTAGEALTLKAPTVTMDLNAVGDYYVPTYTFSSDQSSLGIYAPGSVTLSYSVAGGATVEAGSFTPTTTGGSVTVTVSADGYTSANTVFNVPAIVYTKVTALDFTTATYPSGSYITVTNTKEGKAYETGNKRQQDIYAVSEPSALSGYMAFQGVYNGTSGSKGWWIRSTWGGLYTVSAERSAAVLGRTSGEIVAFNCSQNAANVMTYLNGSSEPDGNYTMMSSTDAKSYYATMTADGYVGFCGVKNVGYISSIVIYSPVVTVSKTISAAGWATYCSPYPLDFSSSIDNLTKAYLVTGATGSTLNLADITGTVPANTGILLEGEGPVTIPVIASSSTDVSANKLVGVTANTEIAAKAGYVLMGSPKVGFYMNNNAFTVGANTAYLPSNFAGARMAFFGFDDEATGIENLTPALSEGEGVVYNLRGQRVAQPTKGLYIVNGKKVVIK